MNEASVAQSVKNAALLSPCHIQNSHRCAVFCGSRQGWVKQLISNAMWIVAIMFLICSVVVLCTDA
jgi:hypothetical protein